jgi:predicted PurR-regulated permease PerM
MTTRQRLIARWALATLAVVAVVWIFIAADSAMTPFIVGLILAYLLAPTVNRLSAFLPRWAAILVVYIVGLVFIILAVLFVLPPLVAQAQRLISNLPDLEGWQRIAGQLLEQYRQTVPPTLQAPIEQSVQEAVPIIRNNVTSILQNAIRFLFSQIASLFGLVTFLVGFLFIPIWLFYVLNDQRRALVSLNRILSYRVRADFWNVWGIVDRSLSAYIRGQLTLGLIIGIAVGIGLGILDLIPGIEVDYILLLALWAGICELIPMIGALLGMIPGILVALVVGGPFSAIVVAILYIVIQQIENNFLVPRIVGDSVGVHPAVLTVVLIAMGQVFGLLGVIVAAPLAAIARDLYLYFDRRLGGKTPEEAIESISRKAEQIAEQAQKA